MRQKLSIRLRLILWYVVLLALILIGFSVALYTALAQQLHQGLDDRLRAEAGSITAQLQRNGLELDADQHAALQLPSSEMALRLLDRSGREVFATGELHGVPIDAAAQQTALRDGGATFTLSGGGVTPLKGYVMPLLHERELPLEYAVPHFDAFLDSAKRRINWAMLLWDVIILYGLLELL